MEQIDRILNELGVLPRPVPAPAPAPDATPRPAGDPSQWRGIWYPDGNIPH